MTFSGAQNNGFLKCNRKLSHLQSNTSDNLVHAK